MILEAGKYFGAKSIPSLARTFGRTIRQVREASSDIQEEIRKSGDEMKKDLNLEGTIRETAEDIRRPLDQYASDLEDSMQYQPPKRTSQVKPMGHNPKQVDPPKVDSTEDKNPSVTKKETKADQPKEED